MDDAGASGYWGWQWVGATRRSFGFAASRTGPHAAPTLSVFRNRLYDQSTGRWTQEDPIGVAGGVNLYQFNGNNPASYIDPFGLKACPPDCGLIHAIGVAAGVVVGGTLGAAAGAGTGTLAMPGVGTIGGGIVGATNGAAIGAVGGLAAANIASETADAVVAAGPQIVESARTTWQVLKTFIGYAVGRGNDAPPRMPNDEPPEPPKKATPAPPGTGKSPIKIDADGTPRITIPIK